jgi:N-acyl-D-amino-acid deacylase
LWARKEARKINDMKYILLFTLLHTACCIQAQKDADLIIRNGRVLDGTGNSWFRADIAIKNGKIIHIGRSDSLTAAATIDAADRIVAPGFIDVHTHIEGEESQNPTADNFILDGVTTVVTGNCGASETDMSSYLRFIDSLRPSINVAALIGHNSVRRAVMGTANRKPSEEELQKMENLVAKAMRDGAVGLSTGLIYIPGTYAETGEVVRLAKAAARFGGVYASHMRDEGDRVKEAIDEAIGIGREAGLPVQISHFKVSGQQNWGRSRETLQLIEKARSSGIDVTIDQYPYTASSTSLSTLFPDELLSDDADSIKARLQRPEVRAAAIAYMLERLKKRKLKHFSYAVVAYHKQDTSLNGKSLEEINRLKGRKHKAKMEAETAIDLQLAGGASMIFHGMCEDDVKRIMQYPFNMFASDASIRIFGRGVPHPRGYGTNARVLASYVRAQKLISLEEAVRRMTSLPAQKFGLHDRGLLRTGFAADILIFDEKEVHDRSTFTQPHAFSTGFSYVIVNGQVVVANGRHMKTRSGKALYRKPQNL